jgi:tetratricopeptide (TPR) repeat protein
MTIKHAFALTPLLAALTLLPGCATAPKSSTTPTQSGDEAATESNEPDLVAQLRERMASGTLQRQEKTEERQPSAATADTSSSPKIAIDPLKQQEAAAVAGDFAKAVRLMGAGKDDEAFALFAQIAEKAPRLSGPLVNQALILNKQQKYAEAKAVLDKALALNPNSPFINNQLGITLRNMGKFAEAKTAYLAALTQDPNYAKASFNLGVLADLYLQDLPLAIANYQRYQSLQSTPDAAVNNWIIDLQKRTGTYVPPAKAAPLPPAPSDTEEDTTDDSAAATEAQPEQQGTTNKGDAP